MTTCEKTENIIKREIKIKEVSTSKLLLLKLENYSVQSFLSFLSTKWTTPLFTPTVDGLLLGNSNFATTNDGPHFYRQKKRAKNKKGIKGVFSIAIFLPLINLIVNPPACQSVYPVAIKEFRNGRKLSAVDRLHSPCSVYVALTTTQPWPIFNGREIYLYLKMAGSLPMLTWCDLAIR